MSDDSTELDALFEEIAAQRKQSAVEPSATVGQAPVADAPLAAPLPEAAVEVVTVDAPLATGGELPMYDCLGGIVRQLHDALRELGYDRALAEIVDQVSDSQTRLEYMATLTEQAANKVLNAVDEAIPAQEAQLLAARDLQTRWDSMFAGDLKLEAFKQLAQDSHEFSASTVRHAEAEKARLLEIMMAQDFQDITGQIIKKVIDLTRHLERDLVEMLRSYAPVVPFERPHDELSGPGLVASAMIQDDVDNLLSELGF